MLSDEEYKALLEALARKHLRWGRPRHQLRYMDELTYVMDQLQSLRRLNDFVAERPESKELVERLAQDLQQSHLRHLYEIMQRSGILDALEEVPDLVFPICVGPSCQTRTLSSFEMRASNILKLSSRL